MRVFHNPPILFLTLFAAGLCLRGAGATSPGDVAKDVAALRAVGPEGKGTGEAQVAWKRLSAETTASLPAILSGMDGANDYALNWLLTAVDTIASRPGATLPVDELKRFLADTTHHPRARRLAFELIGRADPAGARQMLPGFLNDPSNELRRDAVQQVLDAAAASLAAGKKEDAIQDYQRALSNARDVDQIDTAAKQLRDQGQKVDLQKTFGWLTRWKMVAPFDNAGGVGFEKAYSPESNADLGTEYETQKGKAGWQDYSTTHDYGLVDFNKPFTQLKSVAGYAQAEFYSDAARPVELRLGCKNGWKIWFNGQYVFGRDEYHRGAEIDQYRFPVTLKPGRNTILVKCLQNEQKEDWTVEWEFQLRVTDAQGTPVFSTR